MNEIFSGDRLRLGAVTEIDHIREWLNRIEQHLADETRCVDAALLMYLGESVTKLSYTVGMINNLRLTKI